MSILIFIYSFNQKISDLIRINKYINYRKINKSLSNKSSKINKILKKNPKLVEIEEKLNKLDNPYGINMIKYVAIKSVLTLMIILSIIKNRPPVFLAILSLCMSISFLDIIIYLYDKGIKKKVEIDLMNISDVVFLQLSAGISIYSILKNLPSICKCKYFKDKLQDMNNTFEYTSFNINQATYELKSVINTAEVDMFCNALVEQIINGENLNVIENLSSVLREKYFLNVKANTRKKVAVITAGVCIALVNISLIVFYPIMYSFNESFNNIFK